MLRAGVRQLLTREDAQLAVRLVSRGSADAVERAEDELREHGIDALLDDPRLLPALMQARQAVHASLPLFAYVVVRHALLEVEECDRTMADYVASLVLNFGLRERARRVSECDDEVYDTLAALLADVDRGDPARRFLVRLHLGNYALWLSGVFPDHIELRRWRRGGPDLDYYEEMGRRGYSLAAEHRLAAEYGMAGVLSAAADRFPRLRLALNRMSDRHFFPLGASPERLMRQVRDAARFAKAS